MSESRIPTVWQLLANVIFAGVVIAIPEKVFGWWQFWIVGALFFVLIVQVFLLVYYSLAENISNLRHSAARLLDSVRDVDDQRLRTIGVHFPEWHIKPLDDGGHVAYLLEDTTVTREFLVKIMTHVETNNVQIAPVRSFPDRRGLQIMASEFHRLAHRKGWAEPWGGNQTSRWKIGWSATRILILYGCDDVLHIPDLAEVERDEALSAGMTLAPWRTTGG